MRLGNGNVATLVAIGSIVFVLIFAGCGSDESGGEEDPGNMENTSEGENTESPETDPCDGVACSGHGTCVVADGQASCSCDAGFVEGPGLTCDNPCEGETCSGFGTCEVLATGEARCNCDEGYALDGDLNCVDNCAGIDCSGHGQCETQSNGAAHCDCDPYYRPTSDGLDCEEQPDEPCEGIDCSGHGQCVAENGDIFCDCDEGYFQAGGLSCEDPCGGESCSGHGECEVDSDGEASCECDAGYQPVAGSLECEQIPEDPCEGESCSGHGECEVDSDGEAYCDCNSGYQPASSGLACEEIPEDPCQDVDCSGLGTCDDSTGEAVCDCETNYVDPDAGPADCVHRCDNGELEYCDIWKVEGTSNVQWEGYRLTIPSSELPDNADTGVDGPSGPIKAGFGITQQDWGFVLTSDHFYKFDIDIDGTPYWIESRPLSDLDASLASTPQILGAYNIPDAHPTGPSDPAEAADGLTIVGYEPTEPEETQMRVWTASYHHADQDFIVDGDALIDHGHDDWIGKEHAPSIGDITSMWLDVSADQDPSDSWIDEELICEGESDPTEFSAYSGVLTDQAAHFATLDACPSTTFLPSVSHSDFSPFSTADAPPVDSVGATIYHDGALYLFRENPL